MGSLGHGRWLELCGDKSRGEMQEEVDTTLQGPSSHGHRPQTAKQGWRRPYWMVLQVEGSRGRGPLAARLSRPGDPGARGPSLSGEVKNH